MATIQLTDGTTTLSLFDESTYNLIDESWAPAVATRRQDALGGSPYSDVVETLALRIKGTSTADCLDKLHNLTVLLDQADRWRMGENVAAVLFKYKPTGSAANVLSAAVLGTPAGQSAVTVPGRVEWIEGNSFQLFPVIVTFLRRGAWLDNEESDASSSTANPGVMTATNTATDLPSPVKLQLTNFVNPIWGGSFLLVTDHADKIDIVTASTLTTTGFTAVNDSAKLPFQGTNILRYTPTTTNWAFCERLNISTLLRTTTRRIAIYINARRNSAGTEALLKIKIEPLVYTDVTPGTPIYEALETQPIALTETNPQWYYAGEIVLLVDNFFTSDYYNYLSIGLKTSNTSSTVDIDAICLLDADNSKAIYFPTNVIAASGPLTLVADHRLLTGINPLATLSNFADLQVPTVGALGSVYTQAAAVVAIWLAPGYSLDSPYYFWCAVDGTTKLSNVLTAVRRPAFLVPQ